MMPPIPLDTLQTFMFIALFPSVMSAFECQLGWAMVPTCLVKRKSGCCCEDGIEVWLTCIINRLWAKQLSLYNMGGPSNELKIGRAKAEVSEEAILLQDCSINSYLNFQPASLPYRFLIYPATTITWVHSFKWISMYIIYNILSVLENSAYTYVVSPGWVFAQNLLPVATTSQLETTHLIKSVASSILADLLLQKTVWGILV